MSDQERAAVVIDGDVELHGETTVDGDLTVNGTLYTNGYRLFVTGQIVGRIATTPTS